MCQVEGHPVIADVSPYFGTERRPEGREALLILPGARPLLDPLELRPEPFPAGFYLGNRRPFARPPPVEEEAQKLEGALRLPAPGCLFGPPAANAGKFTVSEPLDTLSRVWCINPRVGLDVRWIDGHGL